MTTLGLLASTAAVATVETGYQTPPKNLVDLIDAPASPFVQVTPDQRALLVAERPNLPSIDEVSEPELRLAGLRINPRLDSPSRSRSLGSLSLVTIADGTRRTITGLPSQPRIENLRFAPGGRHVAFTHAAERQIELWVADLETATARRLVSRAIHLSARIAPTWVDSKTLVATAVATDRPAAPTPPRVPSGPIVRENLGEEAQVRTYQDLLSRPYDEALFAHQLTAQLVRIGLDGTIDEVGDPALYWNVAPSPDGRFLLTEVLHTPFSYLVPVWRFPRRISVIDPAGATVREVADVPLQEAVPIAFGSVPLGPRSVDWRSDAPATLVWVEAIDGGDARVEATHRDRLFVWSAPFADKPNSWVDLRLRFAGINWGHDDLAIVTSRWYKTRSERRERLRPGRIDAPAELIVERSYEDRYGDPGRPLTTQNAHGHSVLLQPAGKTETIYRVGSGASSEGNRPFVDAVDLATGSRTRMFHSAAPHYEFPVLPLADGGLLTRRESADTPPNYFVHASLDAQDEAPRQLTHTPHPTPQLAGIHKELVTYEREEGVSLSATLYLPPGHDPERDGPLPMVMWAYPIEFKSAAAASQVTDSPYRFERLSWASPVVWVSRGYAVLDDPKMPIVGEDDAEPNDTFRKQLVASAKAAVDAMVTRGVADRDRIAIGGHSYGAFMTANLLAHSDLFAAGIARSGAYNRTLTPFGFQAEQRTYWEAPEVYFNMSPFMHAEKVNEPILLIHGEADNNSGTFPIQSERYYHALKGHGATVRLVMLPHESHGYRGRESVLHMLYETDAWLERYVKGAAPDRLPQVDGTLPRSGDLP